MQGNSRDYYNLIVRGNLGFSSAMSKVLRRTGKTSLLIRKSPLKTVSCQFNDAVICSNSTFIEVVDSGNRLRGIYSLLGVAGLFALIVFLCGFLYIITSGAGKIPLLLSGIVVFSLILGLLLLLPIINAFIRRDMFRQTHYPMRFNRRDRKVYAWSQDMGVVTMNWDDIQFYTSEATKSQDRRGMSREEIRGYVRDRNGNLLYHVVFFKYEGLKGMKGVLEIWELVRRYMEEHDGHIQAYQVDQRLLDLDGKRESFIHSLIQAKQVLADSRAVQLILAPAVMWAGTGRLIAKWTCRVPRWPEWVEEKCQVAPDDPYVRNRHTEAPLTAKEILWPLFCYLLGWAEVLVILYFCFRGYL
ncbi:DUF6708 domain-containing protein [Salinicola rhizosphaerae]|nr:DUF6708 domain-containing protein [Salinicola rhizosphaerae]